MFYSEEFQRVWYDKTVIVTGVNNNSNFRTMTQIDALLANYGGTRVSLAPTHIS